MASETVGPMLAFIIMATPRPRSAAAACVQRIASAARFETFLELAVDGGVAGEKLLTVTEEVLAAKIHRVPVQRARGLVDQRLEGPGKLGHAEAAEGAARRGVGVDGGGVEGDVRHAVRAGRRVGALLDDAGADVGVGPHVKVGVTLRRPQGPVAPQAHADARPCIAAAHRAEGLLRTGRGVPDARPCGTARPRSARVRVRLAAEAPAERRHDDADAAERQAKHPRRLDADGVGILRGRPHGEVPPSRPRPPGRRAVPWRSAARVEIGTRPPRPRPPRRRRWPRPRSRWNWWQMLVPGIGFKVERSAK